MHVSKMKDALLLEPLYVVLLLSPPSNPSNYMVYVSISVLFGRHVTISPITRWRYV